MKKKFAALALTAVLAVSAAVPAAAAQSTAENATASSAEDLLLSMENIDTSVYEGTWLNTGLGFDLYLPSDWSVIEQTEDMKAHDIVFMASDLEKGWSVSVSQSDLSDNPVGSKQIYEQLSSDSKYTNVMNANANGIPCVTFDKDEDKVSGLAFADVNGQMYTVMVTPNDDKDFVPTMENIIYSVSPSDTTSGAESAEDVAVSVDDSAISGLEAAAK